MAVFVLQHNPLSCNDPFISVQARSVCVHVCVHALSPVYVFTKEDHCYLSPLS